MPDRKLRAKEERYIQDNFSDSDEEIKVEEQKQEFLEEVKQYVQKEKFEVQQTFENENLKME